MPMALLLLEPGTEPRISPALTDRLAPLGVTGITVVRDGNLTGLVLEGWAFDPARASIAADAITESGTEVRLLQPILTLAVTPAMTEGSIP
jgi:hypothetical protein